MHDLHVKVGKYLMNKHCWERKQHKPSESKSCPYCRLCRHGCTEYMHCDKCNADDSWMKQPISDAELHRVLDYLGSHSGDTRCYRFPKGKRNYRSIHILPMAVAKLRSLLEKS